MAASALTATFNGAGAVLALGKAAKFAATIAGFTTGQAIDLLKTVATGATLNGSDQLVIVNGATTIATLQLTGTYAGDTFNVASDGHHGTNITISTGAAIAQRPAAAAVAPAHQFIAAMAGLGVGAAGAAHTTAETWRGPATMLAGPRINVA
jgi:hypothetical protein